MAARKTKSTKADRTELIEALMRSRRRNRSAKISFWKRLKTPYWLRAKISLVNQKIYVSTSTERLAK